ncbi:MAG: hypothetical protein MJ016_07760 [Victivallaceae bacterium]|nr:hypothetical protein [Victivallaceae bacterium]
MPDESVLFAEFFPALILMIGIPGSGKSTFCEKFFPGVAVVSLDRLHTRKRESDALDALLGSGVSAVVDNTDVSRAERAVYVAKAKRAGYRVIGCYMQSTLADCLKRNAGRTGKKCIPVAGVIGRAQKLEIPNYAEGFDFLYYIKIAAGKFVISPWREEAGR